MSFPIKCFLITPTGDAWNWLRRYASNSVCTVDPYGYHNGHTRIEDGKVIESEQGYLGGDLPRPPDNDPRWPAKCICGYEFQAHDTRQLFWERVFQDDKGNRYCLQLSPRLAPIAPVGAIYDAEYWHDSNFKGPDGLSLHVRVPRNQDGSGVSDWFIDGPSISTPNERAWTRTGTIPNITANPSIFVHPPKGFHGWLKNGEITSC